MIPIWIVFLILLITDVSVGWMISESPMPLLLVAVGMIMFGGFRLFGRSVAENSLPFISVSIFIAAFWLFERQLARVMLSDLPVLFHVGVALHFWLWGSRTPRFWMALVASSLIFWTAGTTEIYGNSKLLVRSLAALGIVLPVWYFLQKPKMLRGIKLAVGPLLAVIAASIFLAGLVVPMDSFSGKIFDWMNRETEESYLADSDLNLNAVTVGRGSIDSSSRELPKRADLELNEVIRMHLLIKNRADFSRLMQQPVYLKTSSLAIFDTPSRLAPNRVGNWFLDSDDNSVDGRTQIGKGAEPFVNFSVLIDRELTSTLPLIPGTSRVHVDSIYEFATDWWQIEPRGEQKLIRFDAAVPASALDPVDLSNANLQKGELAKFPFRTPSFSGLSLNIRDLAAKVVPDKTAPLAEKLTALKSFFETDVKYSLAYRNPKNLDPLDNFLFEEKRGHCELFTSATVLMLRHLDIPSRVSYGYLGGEYDLENRLITFRDRDYHSWPEIFIEGKGWQVFDTTPDSTGRVGPPQQAKPRPGAEIDLAAYDDIGQVEATFANQRSVFEIALDKALLFLSRNFVLLLGLIAAAAWAWSFFSKKNRGACDGERGSGQLARVGSNSDGIPRFVVDLQSIGSGLGLPKKAAQTWREFLESLKSEGHCHSEFDAMIDYFYAIRYCDDERDRKLERSFSDTARAFSKKED